MLKYSKITVWTSSSHVFPTNVKGWKVSFFLNEYKNTTSNFFWPHCVFSYHNCHFFSLVALHTAAKKPDRQFNCIFFRSRISERNSISFCCLRDSKLGSRQINHFLAKNKKMQLLESFLPNSILYTRVQIVCPGWKTAGN